MMTSLRIFLFTFLLFALPFAEATQQGVSVELSPQDIATALKENQKQLDTIKQQVSKADTDSQLNKLYIAIQALSAAVEKMHTDLQPTQEKLQAQLEVLGPPPEAGAMTETASVAQQRNSLNTAKKQLDDALKRSQAIRSGALDLSQQITDLRRVAFKSQLALNTGSIFSAQLWSPETDSHFEDLTRLGEFNQQLRQTWDASWQDEWRFTTLGLLILSVAIWTLGRYLLEQLFAGMSIRYLPDGRLRRSFMALATVLITLFAAALTLNLFITAFSRALPLTTQVQDFADGLMRLGVFCALISGLSRAYLSLQRPSWRLAPMDDAIATGMRFLLPLLTLFAMFFGLLELINNIIGASLSSTIWGNWLATALMALILLAIPIRVRRIRHHLELRGTHLEKRSSLVGITHFVILLLATVILFSLLIGYVPFARFLTFQLIWIALVLTSFYFLVLFATDVCAALFSPHTASGRALKKSLNVKDRHLEQLTIVFTAVFKCLLILLMIVALITGSFGTTTPNSLLQKIVAIMSGEGLKSLNIVPSNLLNAIICLMIGLYILRVTQRWLSHELLPKTINDIGIRASLLTLFSNVGYVLLILITLAALGIEWNNLAWIVSALSVGIGFGLQEIVKNFISGLILLTERPVKVGDMIGIGGVEGDVRRINVRATEIQLSDRSTMIVPNSQLISQNVRNATMGNAQGVVTIALTFPTNIDPELVRNILLSAYQEYDAILETPAPYVRFSQLGPDGIILSVTGYVASPRMVGAAKSDLLFTILKLLRSQQVSISSPKEVVFMKQRAKSLADENEDE